MVPAGLNSTNQRVSQVSKANPLTVSTFVCTMAFQICSAIVSIFDAAHGRIHRVTRVGRDFKGPTKIYRDV